MNMEESKNIKKNLFEELKNLRIKKGINLQSLAEASRIQIKYLHALEDGNLLEVPAVYDKLFFRSYIRALNVENEEECFEQFLEIRNFLTHDIHSIRSSY